VILLLEPQRPPGFVSGGYRYQDELGAWLQTRGEGEQRAFAPQELDAAIAAAPAGTIVVVDGLFAALRRQPLPNGVVALLHQVPELAPWSTTPLDVIATSQPTADAVAGTARRVVVVRPGVDACFRPDARQPAGDRLRIVCVGTVWPDKGQLLLIESLVSAPLARPCELVLLGDHGIAPDYVRRIEAAAPPGMLHLLGVCTPAEVAAELQRADLLVSASRNESFGMAVAEAVACGVPVFGFATGEIASFVADGANGWLLPAAAADAQFRQRLHDVVADPAQLAQARVAASRPALPTWDAVAAQFVAACRSLTS
jgi:glycosyltransferase involved in cell wall biosynthesis